MKVYVEVPFQGLNYIFKFLNYFSILFFPCREKQPERRLFSAKLLGR